LPSLTSGEVNNNNLNKTNKHMQQLNNSKLGNVTVLIAASATAVNNRYSDKLPFTLTQKI